MNVLKAYWGFLWKIEFWLGLLKTKTVGIFIGLTGKSYNQKSSITVGTSN